jgi:hypothetical protein
MEPRPPTANSPDVCFENWDCIEQQHQWMRDHPPPEEQLDIY